MSGHGNRSDVLAEISKELVTAAVSAWRGESSDTVPELGIGSAEESDGVLECGADSEIFSVGEEQLAVHRGSASKVMVKKRLFRSFIVEVPFCI